MTNNPNTTTTLSEQTIDTFLKSIDLEQYTPLFVNAGLDFDAFLNLTETDLANFGIISTFHKRQIHESILLHKLEMGSGMLSHTSSMTMGNNSLIGNNAGIMSSATNNSAPQPNPITKAASRRSSMGNILMASTSNVGGTLGKTAAPPLPEPNISASNKVPLQINQPVNTLADLDAVEDGMEDKYAVIHDAKKKKLQMAARQDSLT